MKKEEKQSKPLIAPGTAGLDLIKMMGAQYDPKFRTKEHEKILKSHEGECPVQIAIAENPQAKKYPMEGAKSQLGELGINFHKFVAPLADKLQSKPAAIIAPKVAKPKQKKGPSL